MADETVTVRMSGPVLRGAGPAAVDRFCREASRIVGEDAHRQVQAQLVQVLQHPTGYYQSQISVRSSGLSTVVGDGGVIYGPWLEGVGSRNQTTRFKGYATFRRVAQAISRQIPALIEPAKALLLRGLS